MSERPLRLLLVEDCDDDARLALRALRQGGYTPRHEQVCTAAALRAALAAGTWDVVVTDFAMPGFDGRKALAIVGEAAPGTPCIVVSGAIGEETAVELILGGARDVINKDRLARLAPAVERALAEAQVRREKELLAEQLQHAQKLETIGTLAGGIAHDFNNILTPMAGYAELARALVPQGGKAHRHLGEVLTACARAKELVDQILGFSRRGGDQREPVRLQRVIDQALKLVRAVVPPSVEVRQSIDPHCRPVLADETQLHQVLMNLCTNAFHAMHGSGGELTVKLGEVRLDGKDARFAVPPGDYALLEVADTGSGMDRATLERIFDPYFTTKTRGEGTGLGLALVQNIVRKCGGTVAVESRPGAGTTFRVLLPAVDGEGRPQAARPAPEPAIPGGTERLMVVDDERSTVEFLRELLGSLGYAVAGFDDPRRALEAFGAEPAGYDLVVTDLRMPGLSGLELARRLRALRPGLPVVLCSGNTVELDGADPAAQGISLVLPKPFSMRELAGAVRSGLERDKG